MKFSKYYYEAEEPGKKPFFADPSTVGKTSTGPRFWQQDDYLINRWIKKGVLHLAKALKTKIKTPQLLRDKKITGSVRDFKFREINRIGFDTLGSTLSKNYVEPNKKTKNYITQISKLDLKDVASIDKNINIQEILSSDMYSTNNNGRIALVSILNENDEIQYFIGADAKTRNFFIEVLGKGFEAYASSKKPGHHKSKKPKVNRDEDDGYSLDDKIKIALTGETIPQNKRDTPSDDDESDDFDDIETDETDETETEKV